MKKLLIIIPSIIIVLVLLGLIVFKVMFKSEDEIKSIVLNHMNIEDNLVKKMNIEFDYEDGTFFYDVEFVYNYQEYNYEVDAKSGEIIIFGVDN